MNASGENASGERPSGQHASSEQPHDEPWLVVIDPQTIFASPDSDWGSPMFADIVAPVHALARAYADRVIVTRWVAARPAVGSWRAYLDAWPMADVPADDPVFDVVDSMRDLADAGRVVTATTFGKWEAIRELTGPTPRLILTGVSTDCCVISTALAAADAGATCTIVTDACAGSTPDNHARALDIMALYPPQLELRTSTEVLTHDAEVRG